MAPRTPKMATMSPAAPSKPVIIPTRAKARRRQSNSRSRGERVAEDYERPHDPQALPPSVAAFRAITTSSYFKRPPVSKLNFEIQKVIEGILEDVADSDSGGTASSSSSPHSWRLLLSPPEGLDDDGGGSGFETEDTMLGSLSPLRSLSNESMPPLNTDTESAYTSSSPSPSGLQLRGRPTQERRSKCISSSVPEDSSSDHPLLILRTKGERASSVVPTEKEAAETELPARTRSSLRSNLTASIRRLKSAAWNLSNTNMATTAPNEAQARATISQSSQFTSERRPLPWAEPPDPALRRYLNPITVSPAELYTHHDEVNSRASRRGCTASIQMQTYRPSAHKSEKASAPPTFVLAPSHDSPVDEPVVSAAPRHREPRENSDFLRVIVLEMNMRKVGKLSDVAPGRARLWLPARQLSAQSEEVGNVTPRRWISMRP
ncbi:MAG: hypothetical protein LQ338_003945 [Usnochroma carphineum]|nr:MAG: hypothetical protein LQ338_003945 [Usnochroma carphineum]